MGKAKVFVGSSSEARAVAGRIIEIIRDAGMEPVPWYDSFSRGRILLEAIETLPNDVVGAVFLWTPDVSCQRSSENFNAPVPNVVFEYGYLAARLTHQRVAIYQFDGAEKPSDIEGMLVVRAGSYQKDSPQILREDAADQLRRWLEELPPLSEEMDPIAQVHGYSGNWDVTSIFTRWQDTPIKLHEEVRFEGETLLLVSIHGKGWGRQTGKLYVSTDSLKAIYQIENRVISVDINPDGTVALHVEVRSRRLLEGDDKPLPGTGRFYTTLQPAPGKPKRLKGEHRYPKEGHLFQRADEIWTYLGLGF